MKPPRLSLLLVGTLKENTGALDTALREFVKSGDATSTQALRKAIRRLRASYLLLPKRQRREGRFRRYVNSLRRLSRATGKVRDLDIITAWASEAAEGKDGRSIASDLARLRAASLREAMALAQDLEDVKPPTVEVEDVPEGKVVRRLEKVERRVVKRVDKEFVEFLSSQDVDVMHALRKDSKTLRHLLELSQRPELEDLLTRLRSIQDDLGAIRDHDLEIDYLRGGVVLTTGRSLIREEIAKRHARLEEFVIKNRGRGRLVPVSTGGTVLGLANF